MEFKDFFFDDTRQVRNGFSEVILCQGKSEEQVCQIVREMGEKGFNVLGTRANPSLGDRLQSEFPKLHYHALSRTFQKIQKATAPLKGTIAVLAAGTGDVPVAEEACQTAQFFGVESRRFFDVGVAGLHRLIRRIEEIREANVIIAVAGMEGALPSVVAGLVSQPVIAVPTSVGYGTHFNGATPLHAMLTSCSEGISVVNIDNGFGAACAALRILRHKI